MSELDKKNAAAVFLAIRNMEEKMLAQDAKIQTLHTLVLDLINRVDSVDQKWALQKIASMGTGATVK